MGDDRKWVPEREEEFNLLRTHIEKNVPAKEFFNLLFNFVRESRKIRMLPRECNTMREVHNNLLEAVRGTMPPMHWNTNSNVLDLLENQLRKDQPL